MDTLYDILEVSQKASDEVIEKAYKVLAKKYHPDVQSQENRKSAEEKMKKINEAYEILSDFAKRKEYDLKLEEQRRQEEVKRQERNTNNTYNTNVQNNNRQNVNNNSQYYTNSAQSYQTRPYTKEEYKQEEKLRRKAEKDYIREYKAHLIRLRARFTFKKITEFLITIIIMVLIILVLWIFPPTNKIIVNFYKENIILQTIIDFIWKFILAIINSIASIFKG